MTLLSVSTVYSLYGVDCSLVSSHRSYTRYFVSCLLCHHVLVCMFDRAYVGFRCTWWFI